MSGAHAVGRGTALRESLEVVLGEVLRGSPAESDYALDSITYGDAVEVTFRKGDARFVLWLRPSSDPTACYKQTAFCKLGYREAPPDRSGYALLDAAHTHLQRWEESLPEGAFAYLFDGQTLGSPNLEMLAVRSGLKPACRYVVSAAAVGKLEQDVRAEGLYACVTDGTAFVSRFTTGFVPGETTVVHVGRTEQAARTAAELERAMMSGRWSRLRSVPLERALGRALGYPPCCTEAFLKVRTLPNDTIRFRALTRTPGVASALLNDIDETQSVVSHFVCRYDCVPSARYAEALLAELGRLSGAAGEARRHALQGLVVRFCGGGALRLALTAAAAGERYFFANVEAFGSGPVMSAWHEALRDADELRIADGTVQVFRANREHCRLPAPPRAVQARLFA